MTPAGDREGSAFRDGVTGALLAAEDVTLHFGGVTALQSVSVGLEPDELLAVIGLGRILLIIRGGAT